MRKHWDLALLLIILALGSFSLLVIFSLNRNLAVSQLSFWLIGLLILYIVSSLEYQIWRKFSLHLYLITLLFLLVLIFIGDPVRGSVRWIDLGLFRFQPSEIAKIAGILILANFYTEKSAKDLKNILISFLIILPAIFLILIQPDVGNTLALLAVWLGLSIFRNISFKRLLTLAVVGGLAIILIYQSLSGYQKERIASYLNPNIDPLGTGYNIIQSKIAVGSGQLFGRGLGQGSQSQLKFLPESESDFIFASISEQLGFLGASILIILFIVLVLRLVRLARGLEGFAQLVLVGAAIYLSVQFVVNVGMNMGLLPITGITLPLVSYGGSCLISTLFLFGIIFSIERARTLS